MRRLFLLTLILLVAATLRLHDIDAQSVWFDEGWSANAALQSTLIDAAAADATNPPVYYAALYLLAQLAGTSVFALRWLSFAFGMFAVAFVARLAGRGGASIYATLIATFSLPLLWASQEMRMYTLLAVLVALIALAWERLRTQPTRWAWAVLLVAELAALYTHNTGPVVVLWINAVTLLAWAVRRGPPPFRWIAGQAVVALLWLPYFVDRFLRLTEANAALVRRTALQDPRLWTGLWLAPWEGLSAAPAYTLLLTVIPAVFLIPALNDRRARWLLLHAALLIAGTWAALGVLGNEVHGRYLVMALPPLIAAAGIGLSRLPRFVAFGLGAAYVALFAVGYPLLTSPANQHDDARAMVSHYAETLGPEDTVLAWSYADRYELAYYWDRLGVAAERVTLPEGATLEQILPLLPEGGDVSLNIWYTQRADYRGMAGCLLADGTRTPPETLVVNGMETRTYTEPALAPPDTIPADATFTVAHVRSHDTLPTDYTANQAACVPITIELTGATADELKAALVVTNALGVEVASTSSVFATPDGRTSIDGTLGESLTAFPVLRLPLGTPSGRYDISLRLFDDANLSGYDYLVDGAPAGKDAPLGTWVVEPGAVWPVEPVIAPTLEDTLLPPSPFRNGETVRFALFWRLPPDAAPPTVTLTDTAGEWSLEIPPAPGPYDNAATEWRAVRIPLDAPTGQATLSADGLGTIATFDVVNIPAVYDAPPDVEPLDATYPGIGSLVGYRVDSTSAEDVTITLVWRAAQSAPPDENYLVFVQLLGPDGNVIAQSDALPADGDRPTTTWRPGEIIIDTHHLRPNTDAPPPPNMRAIAGFYTPANRALTSNNSDFVVLSENLNLP